MQNFLFEINKKKRYEVHGKGFEPSQAFATGAFRRNIFDFLSPAPLARLGHPCSSIFFLDEASDGI